MTVKLGTNGQAKVYNNSTGSTNIVVDVFGYDASTNQQGSGSLTAIDPVRIADTRSGSGLPYAGQTVAASSSITIQVAGIDGIPSDGVSGVDVNVTDVNAQQSGFFTVGATPPTNGSSVGNNGIFSAGQVVNSGVTTSLNASGALTIYNGSSGTVDFVVDVDAYLMQGSGSQLTSVTPARICDTRTHTGSPPCSGDTIHKQTSLSVQVAGQGGVPSTGATAAILAVTVLNDSSAGSLIAYPTGSSLPVASAGNFAANQVVNTEITADLSSTGYVSIYNGSGANVDITVDVEGYYTAGSSNVISTAPLYNGDGLAGGQSTGGNTQTFIWDGGENQGSALLLSDGINDYIYGPTGEPVEQINVTSSPPANNPTFMTYTPSDSSWLLTNASGDEVSFYRYDAFGTLAFGTPGSSFGYAGQYQDGAVTSAGLYDMRARWYEPQSGEFMTRDPAFSQTDQAYAYAGDDPVNYSDPTGLYRQLARLAYTNVDGVYAALNLVSTGRSANVQPGMVRIQFQISARSVEQKAAMDSISASISNVTLGGAPAYDSTNALDPIQFTAHPSVLRVA